MKISCAKDLLINSLSIVTKAVSQKTTQPILECILLIADREGFRLMANNLELSIETANMTAEVYDLGTVALEARLFTNIIRSLPENTVDIETDDNNRTTIKSGRAEFKLNGLPGREFPMPSEVKKAEPLTIKSLVFKNMVKQTIFSVSTDENRMVLTGEFLEITPKKVNFVAIDGYRVSFRTTPVEYTTYKDIIVPAKSLNEISSIAPSKEDEDISIFITDRHILFEMSNCTVVSRLIDGQYMEYENLFNTDNNIKVKIDRKDLLSALERAIIVVKEVKKANVDLDISGDMVTITSKTEMGQVIEQVNADIDGDNLVICFNANYLTDILRNIEEDQVEISFMSALSPCIVRGITDDSYKYLVLPIRKRD